MMFQWTKSWCAAVIVLAAAMPTAAQETQTFSLRPQWEEGQQARYEFWSRRERGDAVTFRGQKRQTESTFVTTGEVTWKVDRVNPDGSALATMLIDWIRVEIRGEAGEQVNDTRKSSGDTPSYLALLKAVTGAPITVEVAADGSITGIRNMDTLKSRYRGEGEYPFKEADFVETATDLAALSGPPAQLRTGQSWKQTYGWTHELGTMQHRMNYTLTSVEDVEGVQLATIDGEGSLKLEVDRSTLGRDAPPIDVRLTEGSVESQILYDMNRDEAVGRNSISNEAIQINVRLPQGTLDRRLTQRTQNQVLRISEQQ